MNGSTVKFLRSKLRPQPHKIILDELIKIHGEDKVLDGNVDMWKEVKKLWKSKNVKEKTKWKQALI